MSHASIYRGETNLIECDFGAAETGKAANIRCQVQKRTDHSVIETVSSFSEKQINDDTGALITVGGKYQASWTPPRNSTYVDNTYVDLLFYINGEVGKYSEETVRIEESRRGEVFVDISE